MAEPVEAETPVEVDAPGDDGAREHLEKMRQRLVAVERRATTFAELIRLLSQGEDPRALAQRAVDLVRRATGAAGTYVYLWDADQDRLVMRVATSGRAAEYLDKIKLRLGEGINGWAALLRETVVIDDDITGDARFVGLPNIEEDEFRSMVAVPIVVPDGQLLGVFSLYARQPCAFDANAVTLATEVGPLLASGLVHAQAMTDLRRNFDAAHLLSNLPPDATSSLQRCVDVVAEIIRQQLDADLCTVEVADRPSVGAPARPGVALAATVDPQVRAVSQRVRTRVELPSIAEALGPETSRITTIFPRAFQLGAVTCVRARRFTQVDESILDALGAQAAAVISSIRSPVTDAPLAGRLLAAPTRTAMTNLLRDIGWDGGPSYPVLVRLRPSAYGTPTIVDRMLDALAEVTDAVKGVVTVPSQAAVTLLVPNRGAEWRDFEQSLRGTLKRFRADSGAVSAGVGSSIADARGLIVGLEEAEVALAWAEQIGDAAPIVHYEDVSHLGTLPKVAMSMSRELRDMEQRFDDLIRYDDRHGTDLAGTLENYLGTGCSAVETAKRLFIHRNTLRQRLARIEDLTGTSINDISDWAVAGLAARLSRAEHRE